ncbi:MAG: shikimate kinase [Pseudomonadota bacterium]
MADTKQDLIAARIVDALANRSIVLVGLMGAGKTSVGRRLAQRLDLPFEDADAEIERAAGKTIPEIFADHGEAEFRNGEKRVIARLLDNGPQILATGGGAFMDGETRDILAAKALSVWLNADVDLLLKRVKRRSNRPLLAQGDPKQTLNRLIAERYPVYALADIEVMSKDAPHQRIVSAIVKALQAHFAQDGDAR